MLKLLANSFWLIIPILIWNAIFYSRLPEQYQPDIFDKNIQSFIVYGETVFRALVFGLPLLFTVGLSTRTQRLGLVLYLVGGAAYFLSWLLLIFTPESAWSTSLIGFTAPAYTPILWLIGIALLGDIFYFPIDYKPLYYLIPASIFSIFHCAHVVVVYFRNF